LHSHIGGDSERKTGEEVMRFIPRKATVARRLATLPLALSICYVLAPRFRLGKCRDTVRHFRAALLSATVGFAIVAAVSPAQAWTYKTLHTYTDSNFATDGYGPDGLLWDAASGSLYGVTTYGGDRCPNDFYGGCGVLFQMTLDGTETVLHKFEGKKDGMYPVGGLVKDDAGNIYGTTSYGGAQNLGIVFKLSPDGSYAVLHAFQSGEEGHPSVRLIWDRASGNLYSTTYSTAFKISAKGEYSLWHQFDQVAPSLTLDAKGHAYGVTRYGGDERCDCGTVFALSPQGDETVLYTFIHKGLGFPSSPPVIDMRGDVYGTGYGSYNKGSIFRLKRKGKFNALHRFHLTGASHPAGDLVLDTAGSLYGTTTWDNSPELPNTIFRIDDRRNFQTLYTFENEGVPVAGLIADGAGNLYGTMYTEDQDHSEVFELVK
jgi:uncharacterized repeat protein (TIGR03803 family)